MPLRKDEEDKAPKTNQIKNNNKKKDSQTIENGTKGVRGLKLTYEKYGDGARCCRCYVNEHDASMLGRIGGRGEVGYRTGAT